MSPGFIAAATGPWGPVPSEPSPLAGMSIKDVGPRGFREDGMAFAAERYRCSDLFTGARLQPIPPIEPPAPLPFFRPGKKRIRPSRIDGSDHK
jgi:hypothetical protein